MDDQQQAASLRVGLSVTGLDLAELWRRCFADGTTLNPTALAHMIAPPATTHTAPRSAPLWRW